MSNLECPYCEEDLDMSELITDAKLLIKSKLMKKLK